MHTPQLSHDDLRAVLPVSAGNSIHGSTELRTVEAGKEAFRLPCCAPAPQITRQGDARQGEFGHDVAGSEFFFVPAK